MALAQSVMAGLAVALTSVLVSGCATPIPTHDTGPAAQPGPDVLVREKLPTRPQDFTVLAATGDVIWAAFPEGSPWGGNRISRDGGQSWNAGIGYEEISMATGYRGRLGYLAGSEGIGSPYLMDAAKPSDARPLAWDGEGGVKMPAVGVGAALVTKNLLTTVDRTRRVSFPALPKSVRGAVHSYAFTGDVAQVVRITMTTGTRDYAGVLTTASGKSKGLLRLPRTSQHQVSGSTLYSLVATASGLRLCRQPLPSGTASCRQVVSGNRKGAKATLYQFGALSVINDPGSASPLLVENSKVTKVALPQGTKSWRGEGFSDPTRPLLRTVDAGGEPHHLRVAADGTTTEWMTVPRIPAQVASLALTPTTLLGTWTDDWKRFWTRPLTGDTLGTATLLPGRAVGSTSGARWLVWTGTTKPAIYDNGTLVGRANGPTTALSGPYLIQDGGVQLITGKKLTSKRAQAIFGSLVAERPTGKVGMTVATRIRNLADSSFAPQTVTLSTNRSQQSRLGFWGDWVGASLWTDTPTGDFTTLVKNYRTGQSLSHSGRLWQLGDGYAVLDIAQEGTAWNDGATELAVWNLTTGALIRLGQGTSPLAFAAEGDRIAYTTDTELIIRTIPDTGTSRPRLLGAVASGKATKKSPWKASIDVTKPLAAGTLTISNRSGAVVRTLRTPDAPAGALRKLTWNGRDDAGKAVAKGRYRWTLHASAVDGTGKVVAVTGSGAARGSITVG